MGTVIAPLALLLLAIVAVILIALPVKVAASAMHAHRTGFLWCLLAMAGSYVLHGIGLTVPLIGTVVAFFLSGLAFTAILGTDFLRGIAIELIAIVLSAVVAVIAAVVFGLGLGGLMALFAAGRAGILH